MNIKITNKGHRRGFVQGHVLNPGDSVELNDVNKDGIKQLAKVQWLGVEKVMKKPKFNVEKVMKKPKGNDEKITNEVQE